MKTTEQLPTRVILQHVFQKYESLGLVIAILMHASLLGIYFLSVQLSARPAEKIMSIKMYNQLGPPPSIADQQTPIAVPVPASASTLPSFAIPLPVPDEQAPAEQTIATQTELPANVGVPNGNTTDSIIAPPSSPPSLGIPAEADPSPDQFIAVDTNPELINQNSITVKYPELAIRANLEATIYVKMLVDKDGRVKNVIILKNDGSDIFNNAAIDAAKQYVFSPAIQGGRPVKLWVSMPIRFRLR